MTSPGDPVRARDPESNDVDSDYGSDFGPEEELLLEGIFSKAMDVDNPNLDADLRLKDIGRDEATQEIRLPAAYSRVSFVLPERKLPARGAVDLSAAENDPDRLSSTKNVELRTNERSERSVSIEAPSEQAIETPDFRSPIERFRTKPKKSLSVTDLISPSWCELQYWYTLTKHGRKRRTPAMKRGSAVHKTLEEEVHTFVPVSIQKKEDSWGLRLWNVIQGLRTLRETGMTRELEIWGLLDGLVIHGVVDELSLESPDKDLEFKANEEEPKSLAPAGQAPITDFLGPRNTLEASGSSILNNSPLSMSTSDAKIYLTDVKTRASKSLPTRSAFRPTLLQLMVYRRLLCDLASNKVDPRLIFERYDVDPDAPFTDTFIAQIGNLNQDLNRASQESFDGSQGPGQSTQDSLTQLLDHNSLNSLWSFMMTEFSLTFLHGSKSIGQVLKAEYRDPIHGTVMGQKTFLYDEKALDEYINDELLWWRGERAPQGVCVEEAYKCGSCDFADQCSWRQNKIEDAVLKMRERKKSHV